MSISRGSGYKGSPELMNSGANGNVELIPPKPYNGKNYSFYSFEFECDTKPVVVKINGEQICLQHGTFSMGTQDAPIFSFMVVTPNVEFTWIGAYV